MATVTLLLDLFRVSSLENRFGSSLHMSEYSHFGIASVIGLLFAASPSHPMPMPNGKLGYNWFTDLNSLDNQIAKSKC